MSYVRVFDEHGRSIGYEHLVKLMRSHGYVKALEHVVQATGSGFPIQVFAAIGEAMEGARPVREAEADEAGYWVGAPSLWYDYDSGECWLVYRWRNPAERGYKLVIAKSRDFENWTDVWAANKTDFSATAESLERASLVRDPFTGKYYLVFCLDDPYFHIKRLAPADDPADLDPSTGTTIIDVGASGEWDDSYVKDPKVIFWGGYWWCLFRGKGTAADGGVENSGLAYTANLSGSWTKWAGNPVLGPSWAGAWGDGGANHMCAVSVMGGLIVLFSLMNTATGMAHQGAAAFNPAVSSKYSSLTYDEPLYGPDRVPGYELRYFDVVIVEDTVVVALERVNADGSHDLCVGKAEVIT